MLKVPPLRIRNVNDAQVRPEGAFVLYWMTAARRLTHNFALDRSVELAAELGKPLFILEDLRCGKPWDSDRLHRFVLDGMRDNAARARGGPALYHPYVESRQGETDAFLRALGGLACAVVADDYPSFVWPGLLATVARDLPCSAEAVDGNGLLPLRVAEAPYPTAFAFRRFLQAELPRHLSEAPSADPLAEADLPPCAPLPEEMARRWPAASDGLLDGSAADELAALPIDHSVEPSPLPGGPERAEARLQHFIAEKVEIYAATRNHPDDDGTSGLSPYLHFGHISAHRVFEALAQYEGWTPDRLAGEVTGHSGGWWGMSDSVEAFLDELVTWRELGFNMTAHRADYDRYEALPSWALSTLGKHAEDPRPYTYSRRAFEAARTHDPLWNAAQRQLLREGRIHNYVRMLWGKKILEWSPKPGEALATMVYLNNKYALDGRDPNSYAGILWCLGRYDRPLGPERPVFGTVRYMDSRHTAHKVRVRRYLERYGP